MHPEAYLRIVYIPVATDWGGAESVLYVSSLVDGNDSEWLRVETVI